MCLVFRLVLLIIVLAGIVLKVNSYSNIFLFYLGYNSVLMAK